MQQIYLNIKDLLVPIILIWSITRNILLKSITKSHDPYQHHVTSSCTSWIFYSKLIFDIHIKDNNHSHIEHRQWTMVYQIPEYTMDNNICRLGRLFHVYGTNKVLSGWEICGFLEEITRPAIYPALFVRQVKGESSECERSPRIRRSAVQFKWIDLNRSDSKRNTENSANKFTRDFLWHVASKELYLRLDCLFNNISNLLFRSFKKNSNRNYLISIGCERNQIQIRTTWKKDGIKMLAVLFKILHKNNADEPFLSRGK